MPHPAARDSATLILLRAPQPDAEAEVLLVERPAASRAFAGAHVFPGGLVDPEDTEPALAVASDLPPAAAVARLDEPLAPAQALAFWVAALRELFEETGILLAEQDGAPVDLRDPARRTRFAAHRAALLDGTRGFAALVAEEGLRLPCAALGYFSRWITPVNAPRRYDARFFVTEAPARQEPAPDPREVAAVAWITPAAVLTRAAAGTLVLTPPTHRTLEELAALGSLAAILAAGRTRRCPPILPKLADLAGTPVILYPGDAAYDAATPGCRLDPADGGSRNRVVRDGANWRSERSY